MNYVSVLAPGLFLAGVILVSYCEYNRPPDTFPKLTWRLFLGLLAMLAGVQLAVNAVYTPPGLLSAIGLLIGEVATLTLAYRAIIKIFAERSPDQTTSAENTLRSQ